MGNIIFEEMDLNKDQEVSPLKVIEICDMDIMEVDSVLSNTSSFWNSYICNLFS